jgi:hypothetical protein
MSHPDFTVEIAQNEYLPEGGDDVNAIVTVTSPDTMAAAPAPDEGSAEIIIVDCSGSMRSPQTKIAEARAATAAAIDVIRDGVAFAVIAGTHEAQQGDEETATAKLGRAVAVAEQSGNEGTARPLAKVVDVVDAATGTVRLKKKVDDADEMALDTRSTKTVRTRK